MDKGGREGGKRERVNERGRKKMEREEEETLSRKVEVERKKKEDQGR